MKYIVYVKEYINEGLTRDYIYSEYSGIKHDTKEDAEKEIQEELIKFIFPDYYIAEED